MSKTVLMNSPNRNHSWSNSVGKKLFRLMQADADCYTTLWALGVCSIVPYYSLTLLPNLTPQVLLHWRRRAPTRLIYAVGTEKGVPQHHQQHDEQPCSKVSYSYRTTPSKTVKQYFSLILRSHVARLSSMVKSDLDPIQEQRDGRPQQASFFAQLFSHASERRILIMKSRRRRKVQSYRKRLEYLEEPAFSCKSEAFAGTAFRIITAVCTDG